MISFIIPAYNEGQHICQLIKSLLSMFPGCEVIIVDDGSTDNTQALISDGVKLVVNDQNYGKGYCLKRGTAVSKGDVVVFLDSNDFPTFQLPKFLEGEFDVRIGSKFLKGSHCFYPFKRRVMSYVYKYIVKYLFRLDVKDTQTGIKAFKGDLIRKTVPLVENNGFVFDLELLYYLRDYKIQEHPIYISKVFGKVGSCDALNMLIRTLLLRFQLLFPVGQRKAWSLSNYIQRKRKSSQ